MRQPQEADFAVTISFDRGTPDPARVFRAAQKMIAAFESIDRMLVAGIDSNIQPVLVLEDIEASSLKVWLRNVLESTDDQALKELDWKPQVGKYLVKAKYVIIDMIDGKTTITDLLPFRDVAQKIKLLAQETDVKYFPDYREPSIKGLIEATSAMAKARAELGPNDSISVQTAEGSRSLQIEADFAPESFEDMLIKEKNDWPAALMILKVKRPDYLGAAKWEFRHGRTPVHAKIEDKRWMEKFRSRDASANVRPGDALRCDVEREVAYGFDGEVIRDNYRIVKVHGVVEGSPDQMDAFADE